MALLTCPALPAPFPCAAWSMHRAPERASRGDIHHSPHVPRRQPLTTSDGRFQGVLPTSRPAQPPTPPPQPIGAVNPHGACHERLHMRSASHEDFISSNNSPPPRATASPCPLLPRKRVRAPERRGLRARIFWRQVVANGGTRFRGYPAAASRSCLPLIHAVCVKM